MVNRSADVTPDELEARRKRREYIKRYLAEHPEKRETAKKAKREWKKNNPEKVAAAARRHREARRDHINAYWQRWRRANLDRVRAYKAKWLGKLPELTKNFPPAGEALRARLAENALYIAAAAAVPRSLPRHVREDAIQSLILAVCAGEFCQDNIPHHAKRIIASEWGLMDRPDFTSLDEIIPGTGYIRRADLLSADTPHF